MSKLRQLPGKGRLVTEDELHDEPWVCSFCHKQVRHPDTCPNCNIPRREALIVVPEGDLSEDAYDRLTSDRTCGDCIHFDLKRGQELLHNDQDPYFARLLREFELKSISNNMDWKQVGICLQWRVAKGKNHITCATSPARCAKHHVDSSVPYKEKDHNVPCPAWKPRSGDGKQIRSYRMVKGSKTVGTD